MNALPGISLKMNWMYLFGLMPFALAVSIRKSSKYADSCHFTMQFWDGSSVRLLVGLLSAFPATSGTPARRCYALPSGSGAIGNVSSLTVYRRTKPSPSQ